MYCLCSFLTLGTVTGTVGRSHLILNCLLHDLVKFYHSEAEIGISQGKHVVGYFII